MARIREKSGTFDLNKMRDEHDMLEMLQTLLPPNGELESDPQLVRDDKMVSPLLVRDFDGVLNSIRDNAVPFNTKHANQFREILDILTVLRNVTGGPNVTMSSFTTTTSAVRALALAVAFQVSRYRKHANFGCSRFGC